jgi:hypothetical protein
MKRKLTENATNTVNLSYMCRTAPNRRISTEYDKVVDIADGINDAEFQILRRVENRMLP